MKHSIQKTHWQDFSFISTIVIFGLGMIHISFVLVGLLCYISPFVLYLKYKDKTWCQKYCPRASFLTKTLGKISLKLKQPKWLGSKEVKNFFVIYMGLNLFFALMSTMGVAFGRIESMDYVRLFMAFRAPFDLPQLLSINQPAALIHFSYRVYSMLFSSVLIGLVLGFLFVPRTWCTICPVNTLSVPKSLRQHNGKKPTYETK